MVSTEHLWSRRTLSRLTRGVPERHPGRRRGPPLVDHGVDQVFRRGRSWWHIRSARRYVNISIALRVRCAKDRTDACRSRAQSAGHPFDLTKTRLQTAAPGTYTGAMDVVRKALARDGMTGCVPSSCLLLPGIHSGIFLIYSLYRGVVPPLLGVTPIFAVSFWV